MVIACRLEQEWVMTRGEQTARDRGALGRLASSVTRRQVLRGAGVAGAGLVSGQAVLLRSAAQQSTTVQEMIDTAITAEALATTLIGAALQQEAEQELELGDDVVAFLQAAQCEEEAHYHFFEFIGGVPATETFTIPTRTFRDRDSVLRALIELEELFIAGYMAAARQFATMGDLRLVEIAYQIGAVEAQHQALMKFILGDRPANDRAFAKWSLRDITEMGPALAELEYVGGPGQRFDFPGPLDRQCRGVFGLVPETTPDEQGLPTESPAPSPTGLPAPPEPAPTPEGDGTGGF
jgi:hypothetical protein